MTSRFISIHILFFDGISPVHSFIQTYWASKKLLYHVPTCGKRLDHADAGCGSFSLGTFSNVKLEP